MMRRCFELVGHDAGGTVPPMLAIAEALVARGHDVIVLSQPSVRARAEAAGCTFAAFSKVPDYERRIALEDQLGVVLEALTGRAVGDDLLALAEQRHVDAVVVDANLGGALAAAERLDRPSAVLLHSMYKTFVDLWFGDLWPFVEPAINQTRASHELPPAGDWPSVFAAHERLIAVVPSVFDAAVDDVPASMRHFGFLVPRGRSTGTIPGFPPGDDPTVLVSLSTTYQQQHDLLDPIIEAVADLPVRALVTTAGQVDIEALPQADNITLAEFAPHTSLLDRTDVMVTHAGLGTVASSLTFGVPLVGTPVSRDQPLNAQRVADLGAGVALDSAPTAAAIAEGIAQVLTAGSFRDGARALAETSAAEGGPAAVAADLEALLD